MCGMTPPPAIVACKPAWNASQGAAHEAWIRGPHEGAQGSSPFACTEQQAKRRQAQAGSSLPEKVYLDQAVELLVSTDGKLQMPGCDTLHLQQDMTCCGSGCTGKQRERVSKEAQRLPPSGPLMHCLPAPAPQQSSTLQGIRGVVKAAHHTHQLDSKGPSPLTEDCRCVDSCCGTDTSVCGHTSL